jgi:hypothetical protein
MTTFYDIINNKMPSDDDGVLVGDYFDWVLDEVCNRIHLFLDDPEYTPKEYRLKTIRAVNEAYRETIKV